MPEITDGKYNPGDRLVSPSREVLAVWVERDGLAWEQPGGGRFGPTSLAQMALRCGAIVQRDMPEQKVTRYVLWRSEVGFMPKCDGIDEQVCVLIYSLGGPEPIPDDVRGFLHKAYAESAGSVSSEARRLLESRGLE